MAHFDQPSGRGHDHFCGDVRRDLSWNTCRPNLVCLVVVSTAQLQRTDLAAIPVTVVMGRVCGLDLFHGILPFLVYGTDPRPGDYPRSLQKLFQ